MIPTQYIYITSFGNIVSTEATKHKFQAWLPACFFIALLSSIVTYIRSVWTHYLTYKHKCLSSTLPYSNKPEFVVIICEFLARRRRMGLRSPEERRDPDYPGVPLPVSGKLQHLVYYYLNANINCLHESLTIGKCRGRVKWVEWVCNST